jgi:hypothetical protein
MGDALTSSVAVEYIVFVQDMLANEFNSLGDTFAGTLRRRIDETESSALSCLSCFTS